MIINYINLIIKNIRINIILIIYSVEIIMIIMMINDNKKKDHMIIIDQIKNINKSYNGMLFIN